MTTAADRQDIEALGRGLHILDALTEQSPSLNLTGISSAVGLDKSTVFRLVYAQEKLGHLLRGPQTKRYRLVLEVVRLGSAALSSLGPPRIAQPYLRALSKLTGETTNMTVLDGREIVHVARDSTQQNIIINLSSQVASCQHTVR